MACGKLWVLLPVPLCIVWVTFDTSLSVSGLDLSSEGQRLHLFLLPSNAQHGAGHL